MTQMNSAPSDMGNHLSHLTISTHVMPVMAFFAWFAGRDKRWERWFPISPSGETNARVPEESVA